MSNFDELAALGSKTFLQFDQHELLQRFPLQHDDTFIYIDYFGQRHAIERATGQVTLDGSPAAPVATLAILDVVCNPVGQPHPIGRWCTPDELSGAVTSPTQGSVLNNALDKLSAQPQRIAQACQRAGGTARAGGDVSYVFEAFEGVPIWMQYWMADDEFAARLSFLWDRSASFYFHYETLWYVMIDLLGRIEAHLG